jgi:hypothetical protein
VQATAEFSARETSAWANYRHLGTAWTPWWDGYLKDSGYHVDEMHPDWYSRDVFEQTINRDHINPKLGGTRLPEFKVGGNNPDDSAFDQYRLDRGCIGIVDMALLPTAQFAAKVRAAIKNLGPKAGDPIEFLKAIIPLIRPELLPNVAGAWNNIDDAKNLKGLPPLGPMDKVVLFALQGPWKGNKQPKADKDGKVPIDSIDPGVFDPKNTKPDRKNKYGNFNYGVYLPSLGLWLDATHGVNVEPDGTPLAGDRADQKFRLLVPKDGALPPFENEDSSVLDATIYFVMVIPGKLGPQ